MQFQPLFRICMHILIYTCQYLYTLFLAVKLFKLVYSQAYTRFIINFMSFLICIIISILTYTYQHTYNIYSYEYTHISTFIVLYRSSFNVCVYNYTHTYTHIPNKSHIFMQLFFIFTPQLRYLPLLNGRKNPEL